VVYNIFGGGAAVATPLANTRPLLSMDTVGNRRTVVKVTFLLLTSIPRLLFAAPLRQNIRSFEIAYLWCSGLLRDRRPCPVNRFTCPHPRQFTARPVILLRQSFRHPSGKNYALCPFITTIIIIIIIGNSAHSSRRPTMCFHGPSYNIIKCRRRR